MFPRPWHWVNNWKRKFWRKRTHEYLGQWLALHRKLQAKVLLCLLVTRKLSRWGCTQTMNNSWLLWTAFAPHYYELTGTFLCSLRGASSWEDMVFKIPSGKSLKSELQVFLAVKKGRAARFHFSIVQWLICPRFFAQTIKKECFYIYIYIHKIYMCGAMYVYIY